MQHAMRKNQFFHAGVGSNLPDPLIKSSWFEDRKVPLPI
jgi:hypothetical protein